MCSSQTWYDGHDHHVEHVVQEECDGDGDQDQLPLVVGLLEGVPPLLSVLSYRFISQSGESQVVEAHIGAIFLSRLCVVFNLVLCWSLSGGGGGSL